MTVFEKIINREIPAYIIYEDDLVISFLDIQQTTKGHTLVVTKNPYQDIFEIDEETLAHLIKVVKKIAGAVSNAFNASGINLINNNKIAAGQTVMHYHMHIVPRYIEDNFNIIFNNNMGNIDALEYEKRALLIKEALL